MEKKMYEILFSPVSEFLREISYERKQSYILSETLKKDYLRINNMLLKPYKKSLFALQSVVQSKNYFKTCMYL